MTALAITGVGLVLPGGTSPQELLATLDARRRTFSEAPREELPGCRSRWAARVGPVDPSPALPPPRARRLDPASLFAVLAATDAVDAAGLTEAPWLDRELGVVLGTTSAGSGPLARFLGELFRRSPQAAPPFDFPNTVPNAPASHVSLELGLGGPNATLAQKQSVIVPALLYAELLMRDRRCRGVLVGAADEWTPAYQAGYEQFRALRASPDPAGSAGILLNEGACLLVVEELSRARARGGRVLARVAGIGLAAAAGDPSRWRADAEAFAAAIERALAAAAADPGDVGSVVLAANGVPALEAAEAAALDRIFGGQRLAASGIKGAIGESATAGAASLAVAALARDRGLLPPFAGGSLAAWPGCVRPLAESQPLPAGGTLVLVAGVGGNFGAVVLR